MLFAGAPLQAPARHDKARWPRGPGGMSFGAVDGQAADPFWQSGANFEDPNADRWSLLKEGHALEAGRRVGGLLFKRNSSRDEMAGPLPVKRVTRADDKEAIARRVLDLLPRWFGIEEAKRDYVRAARELPMFACVRGDQAIAFLTLKIHNEVNAEIHALGVLPQFHRRKLGTDLVRSAERHARERGLRFLTVKTLAASAVDESYRSTRCFYRAVGFVALEELPNLWGPSNPCLMMIKCLDE